MGNGHSIDFEDDDFFRERKENDPPENLRGVRNDVRTPYEKDYSRLIHSSYFRRLQTKTQVLGVGDSDFYRTRLTHSLEVMQIAVGITNVLRRKKTQQLCKEKIYLKKPLVRAIALAHDLGHPPFGHGGEVALNKAMITSGGFEGNGQTIRILTKLDHFSKSSGADLTRRSLLGVLKYPAKYSDVVNHDAYKLSDRPCSENFVANDYKPPKCYLDSEQDVVDWIGKAFSEKDWELFQKVDEKGEYSHKKTRYKSLDATIMDLADDIAYGVHDLEDAIALGFINRDRYQGYLQKYLEVNSSDALENLLEKYNLFNGSNRQETLSCKLFSIDSNQRKHAIGSLVGLFIDNVQLKVQDEEFKHWVFKFRVVLPEDLKGFLDILKELVVEFMIKPTRVQHLEYKGQLIVARLFDAFATDPKRLLQKSDFEKYKKAEGDHDKMRVVCDYVAGMTDVYASKRYQQLFLPNMGSVFEQL